MNPLTNVKGITKLSENELKLGVAGKASWHSMYSHSAWIFVGGLNFELTEGDIICVFSQYGEIADINLVRDKESGKSKGYCFICYEDQQSTILAVDNLNGIKLVGRIIRVDHCGNYETPEERERKRQEEKEKRGRGRESYRYREEENNDRERPKDGDRERDEERQMPKIRDRDRDRDRKLERDHRRNDYPAKRRHERRYDADVKSEKRSR